MYKTFSDLKFKDHPNGYGGVISRILFDNGYGASIIKTPSSYGGNEGLYELAVTDLHGQLTYDTPITDDVIGYLSEEEVSEVLKKIQELPPYTA